MAEYKVLKGNIIYNGGIYRAGSTVDMDDAIAQNLSKYLEVAQAAPKQQPEVEKVEQPTNEEQTNEEQTNEEQTNEQPNEEQPVDYNEYTIAELKKIVEKENVEVIPTGSKGSAVKSDYIKALQQSK